ncbi:MAG: hypothetical protein HY815_01665 [Candidatus Riflebacteria bacterium]|nr:hypothetical protein [Candidatus Riflebacteria bacterium]
MTRPIRMTALALALVTSGSWAFARSATVGLDPKAAGNSDRPFYAAWLCRRDGGGGNYADVYKGLRVEVLQKGAGSVFYKVRVPYPNSLVVRWDRSWPAVEGDTVGWVNGRFLILSPGETPGQSGSATTPAAGAGGSAGSGAPITILGTESDTGGGGAAAGTASPGPGPGTLPFPPAGGTVPVQGAAQGQLGLEAWRKTLPQLAYIFSPTGDDENYFDALALGRPSDIVDMVRADAAAAQAAAGLTGSYRLVRVKVSSIQEYYTVLRDGLAPPQDRARAGAGEHPERGRDLPRRV